MNIEEKLDALKKIRDVDAPPFLFTRIQQELRNSAVKPAPIQWKWTFAMAAIIILILNLFILFKPASSVESQGINSLVYSMSLSNSNDLYYE